MFFFIGASFTIMFFSFYRVVRNILQYHDNSPDISIETYSDQNEIYLSGMRRTSSTSTVAYDLMEYIFNQLDVEMLFEKDFGREYYVQFTFKPSYAFDTFIEDMKDSIQKFFEQEEFNEQQKKNVIVKINHEEFKKNK